MDVRLAPLCRRRGRAAVSRDLPCVWCRGHRCLEPRLPGLADQPSPEWPAAARGVRSAAPAPTPSVPLMLPGDPASAPAGGVGGARRRRLRAVAGPVPSRPRAEVRRRRRAGAVARGAHGARRTSRAAPRSHRARSGAATSTTARRARLQPKHASGPGGRPAPRCAGLGAPRTLPAHGAAGAPGPRGTSRARQGRLRAPWPAALARAAAGPRRRRRDDRRHTRCRACGARSAGAAELRFPRHLSRRRNLIVAL